MTTAQQIADLNTACDALDAQLKPLRAQRDVMVQSGEPNSIFDVHTMNVSTIRPLEEQKRAFLEQIAILKQVPSA